MRYILTAKEDEFIQTTEELKKLRRQGKLTPEQIDRLFKYTSELHQTFAEMLKKLRDEDKAVDSALDAIVEKYGPIRDYVGVKEEVPTKPESTTGVVSPFPDGQKNCSDDVDPKKQKRREKKNKGRKRAKPRGGRNKGSGNRTTKDYPDANRTSFLLGQNATPGAQCPCCKEAKLHSIGGAEALRFLSSPELIALILEIQKSRCSSCGTVFAAELPDVYLKENCIGKFTAQAAAQIIFTKYGAGIPNARLSTIQGYHHTPVADATMWNVTKDAAKKLFELERFFEFANANAESRMVDDGSTFIIEAYLEIQDEVEKAIQAGFKKDDVRVGQHMTCYKFMYQGAEYRYFSAGREHQGEREFALQNNRDVQTPLLRMSDAGSSTGAVKPMPSLNKHGFTPQKTKIQSIQRESDTLVAYCLQHLRLHIIEASPGFRSETNTMLDAVNQVFAFDRDTDEMTPEERLAYHQQNSQPVMDALYKFSAEQKLRNKKAEPNDLYGKLLNYVLGHWAGFTLFLKMPGVELSTNDVERDGVKFSKRHKKNSLGFQTYNGADVGCFFMSLIASCLAAKKNPIHYLTTVLTFAGKITSKNAHDWTPQKYEETAKQQEKMKIQNSQGFRILHRTKKISNFEDQQTPPIINKINLTPTAVLN